MRYEEFTEDQLLLLNMAKEKQIPGELYDLIQAQGDSWNTTNNIRTLLWELFGAKFGFVYFVHLEMFRKYDKEKAEKEVKKFMARVTNIRTASTLKELEGMVGKVEARILATLKKEQEGGLNGIKAN